MQAIIDKTKIIEAEVDELVDIADPYNRYARSLPSSPFLSALLSESRVPSVSHGIETIAPKFGVTHSQILAASGVSVNLPVEEMGKQISDPDIGWAYVDQSVFCPSLYALRGFRKRIVKRTCYLYLRGFDRTYKGPSKNIFTQRLCSQLISSDLHIAGPVFRIQFYTFVTRNRRRC